MGVRGLAGWISWAVPETIKTPNWTAWKGKSIGFDILGFLYKAKAQKKDPIAYLGSFLAAAAHLEIRLLPVFDGKPPSIKKGTVEQRSSQKQCQESTKQALMKDLESVPLTTTQKHVLESKVKALDVITNYLTSEERDRAKQLCYACGILPLNASGEADTVLAHFMKTGVIQAIISNDYDYLARGVETLLVPEGLAIPGSTLCWKQYSLSSILQATHFTYIQFVEMCVLMGCDYTVRAVSLPYKSAYWAIKYRGALVNTLRHLNINGCAVYETAIKSYVGNTDSKELMGEKQWEKFHGLKPVVEPEALSEFRKSELSLLSDSEYALLLTPVIAKYPQT
jgi:flap endonuclease-1